MRKFFTLLFLFSIVFISGSFKSGDEEQTHYKNSGYFFAILNGNMFEMRDEDKYRAELVNKTKDINNNKSSELNRIATSLIFYGNNFRDDNKKLFDEKVEFEYSFAEGELGEPKDLKIEVNYDKHTYYQEPNARFRITKFDWSKDRSMYMMSADFDCKMRRWGFPIESQPVVRMKGRMVNVLVSVGAWVKIKDKVQVAKN